ncbi:uncharacterized protein VTP21DRAFT_8051 [Calcarisporiella thermophila]|uniref:uncharacterized protein n=1 Tax=Calcarisporiella thermophila TaxID=911321 RepID=UPI00374263D0
MQDAYKPYLSIVGWMFIPQLAASFLQSLYYQLIYPVGSQRPQPGQPKYRRHFNRIYSLVVMVYLAYTVVEVYLQAPPTFYDMFNVDPYDFSSQKLKREFRKLSLQLHPDKNPSPEAEQQFIAVRLGFEILSDPVRRFAYDRFGPEVASWQGAVTTRDYLQRGISSAVSFYAGTGLILLVLNVLGKGQFARYWRFVTFAGMACLELSMLLWPSNIFLALIMPGRVTFQNVAVLHQLFITIFIGLSQVGPVLFPAEEDALRPELQHVEVLSQLVLGETQAALRDAFTPFRDGGNLEEELRRKIKQTLLERRLLSEPSFKEMYSRVHGRVIKKRA